MTTIDLHSLSAPYALDAVDADERTRFTAHLEQCSTCRAELDGFQETTARLGEALAHTPPPALRARLLSEISSTRQERPVVTSLAEHRGLRRTLPRLAMAAAFLVGTVGVGGYAVERNSANDARNEYAAVSSVLAAADATTSAKTFPGGGNVRMISSAGQDAAVIFANDLPSPGADKVYQVWMVDGSGATSHGTFVTDGQMIMKGLDGAQKVAVTVEPTGGSAQPTTAPIATIPV
ncbi:anti-sigma factor [Aeromicrobium sp.]|uniref:anti-sigma factor n=1 Tax=Aeromicrobium sp. TaxID=1871063 RepID=UPI003C477D1D